MKQYCIKTFTIVGFIYLTLLNACKIDTFPETMLSEDKFWKTETDFKFAANQLYALLDIPMRDLRADDASNGRLPDLISSGTRIVPAKSNDWTVPYNSIFVANRIIQNEPSSQITGATFDLKILRYVAEARFFRAYNYFLLVSKFGDIPLMDRTATDSKDSILFTSRTPRDSVVRFIYEDLDEAIKHLPKPSQLSVEEYGRVTWSAALGLKARVALYEGTRAKYHNYNSDHLLHLKTAYEAADAVIQSTEHSLYTKGNNPYHDLFLYEGEGPDNKENIFVKLYGYPNEVWLTNNIPYEYAYSFGPTRNFLNLYLNADGKPYLDYPSSQLTYNAYLTDRDPRLLQTILLRGEPGYLKDTFFPYQNSKTAFSFKKFVPTSGEMDHPSTVDLPIMRYAEILLIYAEAKFEHDGMISDLDLDVTINKLRDRIFFTHLTNSFVTANGMDMLEEIRRERNVELAFEGFRYNDIMRWKIAEEVLPNAIYGAKFFEDEWYGGIPTNEIQGRLTEDDVFIVEREANRFFEPNRDYLYPVPYNDIASSRGTLDQNPNWQ